MRRFTAILIVIVLLGCVSNRALSASDEAKMREYSATAVTLSDFSMKIVGYYEAQSSLRNRKV